MKETHLGRYRRVAILSATLVASLGLLTSARATWKTLVDGTAFNSVSAFTAAYNYNYPWGDTHNGSAKMFSTNISFSGGTANIQSLPVSGQGSIHYYSGTFYLKNSVTVDANHPIWDVSCQAEVPTATGTWPAFWMTPQDESVGGGVETDFFEFMDAGSNVYSTGQIDWGRGGLPAGMNVGRKPNVPPGFDPSKPHTYGWLWVPATSTSEGYGQAFLDGRVPEGVKRLPQ